MRHFLYGLISLLLIGCASSPADRGGQAREGAARPTPSVPEALGQVDGESRHCVALTMYWEARGEGRKGMLAVGSVVLNRVDDDRFPDSACGVVYQGGETPPCQFSWWCDGRSDRADRFGALVGLAGARRRAAHGRSRRPDLRGTLLPQQVDQRALAPKQDDGDRQPHLLPLTDQVQTGSSCPGAWRSRFRFRASVRRS